MEQKSAGIVKDDRMAWALFGVCWIVYFASYIGRLNYSSAMPSMMEEGYLGASQAGFISMAYFFAYGAGQLLNGMLADRVHPGKMIFYGLFVSGLLNLGMGALSQFAAMAVFWCANGYMQAMIWPPIMRVFSEMLPEEKKVACCVNITSTMALGTLASYLLSAAMIRFFGWRFAFYGAAFCMCLAACIFYFGFARIEKAVGGIRTEKKKTAAQETGGKHKERPRIGTVLLASGLLGILFPVMVHGMLKDGVTSWVPAYLTEVFALKPSFSILITTVLPIVNLTGAYAAKWMYQHIFGEREIKTAAFFFAAAALALFGLWRFSAISVLVSVGLFSIITSSMMAVNTLFVNLLPLRFAKEGMVSSISGFFNACAYLGSAVSSFTIGIMAARAGWSATIFVWFGLTALGFGVCMRKGRTALQRTAKESAL